MMISYLVKELECLCNKAGSMQNILEEVGSLIKPVWGLTLKEQRIISSDKNMQRLIGNLGSLAIMLLVDKDITYTDKIGDLLWMSRYDYKQEFNDIQIEILDGLLYKYDKEYNDFNICSISEEIKTLLNI